MQLNLLNCISAVFGIVLQWIDFMLLDVRWGMGLIILPWKVCGAPPCWWQESQTRTGFLPQPLSGTGMLRVEHT